MMWDPALPRVMAMMTLSVSAHALVAFGAMTTVTDAVTPTPLEPVTVAICDGLFAACAGEPFPEIRDWNSLIIRLDRGPCLDACVIYSVTVRGDGRVQYESPKYADHPDKHEVRIPVAKVRELFEKFREANFFVLKTHYTGEVLHDAPYVITLHYDNHEKRVFDNNGRMAGMPLVVTELENAIDEAANTAQWVRTPDAAQ